MITSVVNPRAALKVMINEYRVPLRMADTA